MYLPTYLMPQRWQGRQVALRELRGCPAQAWLVLAGSRWFWPPQRRHGWAPQPGWQHLGKAHLGSWFPWEELQPWRAHAGAGERVRRTRQPEEPWRRDRSTRHLRRSGGDGAAKSSLGRSCSSFHLHFLPSKSIFNWQYINLPQVKSVLAMRVTDKHLPVFIALSSPPVLLRRGNEWAAGWASGSQTSPCNTVCFLRFCATCAVIWHHTKVFAWLLNLVETPLAVLK